jgi:transcription initiation factor TFIIIB Brf1 subunit/transcription initiation factor TFIIB
MPSKPDPAAARPNATTAFATQAPTELERLRLLLGDGSPRPGRQVPRPRQLNTNNWARKRIADVCRGLNLPDAVKQRSLEFYERIVDLHSVKGRAPPGKRLQLSPRLNWSLVYTTVYLGCRSEEYPKDLRAILGGHAQAGSLREIYRLYRFYKRELRLAISVVDVKTLILSWIDGFEFSELLNESGGPGETTRVRNRAVQIAHRARAHASLKRTSTKLIAAGALTTALVERNPPGPLSRFYQAIASFLHMSEETIRLVASRVAGIL